jgi:hypothetical protein
MLYLSSKMAERQVPITRLGKFFGGEDFSLEVSMGREWLEGDMNFQIVLYKVDRTKTVNDDVYGEVEKDGIQFLAPISINAYVKIEEATEQFLGNSKIIQNEPGLLRFSVYKQELIDLGADIELGDYIGYWITENQVRYYSVIDAGIPDWDNKHTYGGYKGFYYSYTATPVSENEFRGI